MCTDLVKIKLPKKEKLKPVYIMVYNYVECKAEFPVDLAFFPLTRHGGLGHFGEGEHGLADSQSLASLALLFF